MLFAANNFLCDCNNHVLLCSAPDDGGESSEDDWSDDDNTEAPPEQATVTLTHVKPRPTSLYTPTVERTD